MHSSKYPIYCIRDHEIKYGHIIFTSTVKVFNGCDFHGQEAICLRCKDSINAQVWNRQEFYDISEDNPLRP